MRIIKFQTESICSDNVINNHADVAGITRIQYVGDKMNFFYTLMCIHCNYHIINYTRNMNMINMF